MFRKYKSIGIIVFFPDNFQCFFLSFFRAHHNAAGHKMVAFNFYQVYTSQIAMAGIFYFFIYLFFFYYFQVRQISPLNNPNTPGFPHLQALPLCMIVMILLPLWNSEQKNGLLIKLFWFSSDFDETWWNCSTRGYLQLHQGSSKSYKKQKS